jgi:hydrogenase 3 maturation protease
MGLMRKPESWESRLAKELGQPERLVVLGVGNVAKGDDGAGVSCAEALARLTAGLPVARLKIIVAYDTPENFTGDVRKFRATHVLILDAAAGGFPPGTVSLIDPGQIREDDASTHRAPLSLLHAYLERTIGCRAIVLGIEPESFDPGAPLSAGVAEAVEKTAAGLAALLRKRLRSSSA